MCLNERCERERNFLIINSIIGNFFKYLCYPRYISCSCLRTKYWFLIFLHNRVGPESPPERKFHFFESIFRMLWHISAIWRDEKRWKKGKHRKISLNFIWLVDLVQKFCCRKPGPGVRFPLFSCHLKNVPWLVPTLTYQIPFALNIHVTAIKNISVVNLSFNPIAGREWDMMKNHEKLNTIWSWRRKIRSELLNPFFMLSLSDAFLRKRKSANAIWFSFICSRFFIFWFPLDREKLQYPFFMKANEKHSGLCARNVVNGKCLLHWFNHEWQVLACSKNGFENGEKKNARSQKAK